ncbi:MAG: hypothetical protein GYA33_15300, partial [Thermogutta sp.]|nr:hypothetical protein [Thermogutta sp.]
KIRLERRNLAERDPELARVDRSVIKDMRQLFGILWPLAGRKNGDPPGSVVGEAETLHGGLPSPAATSLPAKS